MAFLSKTDAKDKAEETVDISKKDIHKIRVTLVVLAIAFAAVSFMAAQFAAYIPEIHNHRILSDLFERDLAYFGCFVGIWVPIHIATLGIKD